MAEAEYITEEWRPVVGKEGSYEVSSFGRVRSVERTRLERHARCTRVVHLKGCMLTPGESMGYPAFMIAGRWVKCHRLVAKAFIPNPLGLATVNHKDGDKWNNYKSNLEWASYRDNNRHAFLNGLMPLGEDRYNARLTEDDVRMIRSSSATSAGLARLLGVSDRAVRAARHYQTWRHVK